MNAFVDFLRSDPESARLYALACSGERETPEHRECFDTVRWVRNRRGPVPTFSRWCGCVRFPNNDCKAVDALIERICCATNHTGQNFLMHYEGFGGWVYVWIGPLPKSSRPHCGAMTKTGKPCRAKCLPGKRFCRLHGVNANERARSLAPARVASEKQLYQGAI